MSHSQFHCTSRVYLHLHGLIFETSICYWQDQPGNRTHRETPGALRRVRTRTGRVGRRRPGVPRPEPPEGDADRDLVSYRT